MKYEIEIIKRRSGKPRKTKGKKKRIDSDTNAGWGGFVVLDFCGNAEVSSKQLHTTNAKEILEETMFSGFFWFFNWRLAALWKRLKWPR